MVQTVVITIIVVLVAALGVVLIRFNLKRLHIIRCAKKASDRDLEAIYTIIHEMGAENPNCAILARTNRTTTDDTFLIPIPAYIGPWANRVITIDSSGKMPSFRCENLQVSEPILRNQIFRLIPVPRNQTKTGKLRNQFSPSRYISKNEPLLQSLKVVCAKYPQDLLSYLLASGIDTFEFDPMNQARIGGSPSWVQDAEFPNCELCKKRMDLVLQLPGTMLPHVLSRGIFFFFGCAKHPENTKTIAQFT